MSKELRAKAVTIKDIARHLGVSHPTVSLALNQKKEISSKISEAMRERVLQAANEMGYRPNIAARALRMGKANRIGVLMSPRFGHAGEGSDLSVVSEVQRSEYEVVSHVLPDSRKADFEDVMARFRISGVSGVLVCGLHLASKKFEQEALRLGMKAVSVGGGSPNFSVPRILPDKRKGFRELVHHLAERGARDIAFLTSRNLYFRTKRNWHFKEAYQGVTSAEQELADQGVEITWVTGEEYQPFVPESDCEDVPRSVHGIYAGMRGMIERDRMPDAVMCATDSCAQAALRACGEAGVRVPHDVMITGFDGESSAALGMVPLTTCVLNLKEMAVRSVERLIGMIEGDDAALNGEDEVRVYCPLVNRRSTQLLDG